MKMRQYFFSLFCESDRVRTILSTYIRLDSQYSYSSKYGMNVECKLISWAHCKVNFVHCTLFCKVLLKKSILKSYRRKKIVSRKNYWCTKRYPTPMSLRNIKMAPYVSAKFLYFSLNFNLYWNSQLSSCWEMKRMHKNSLRYWLWKQYQHLEPLYVKYDWITTA